MNLENFGENVQGYIEEEDISKIDSQLKEQGKQGIVFDPSGGLEGGVAPVNLPDVGEILDKIQEILEYMCTDEIINLKDNDNHNDNDNDNGEYVRHMESIFPAFSCNYYSLFQKIISGDDLNHLFSMLGAIERIKDGEITVDEVEKNLGEELAEEYVYPHIANSKPSESSKSHKSYKSSKKGKHNKKKNKYN